MSSNKATIEINNLNYDPGRTRPFALMRRRVNIQRTFPAILDGHMSQSEWESFCNEVDKTVAPLQNWRRHHTIRLVIGTLLPVLPLGGFLYYMLGFDDSYYDLDAPWPPKQAIVFGVLLFFSSMLIPLSFRILYRQCEKLELEMRRVLSVESAKRSNVSFHLHDVPMVGKNIECEVSSATVSSGGTMFNNAAGGVFPVPVPVAVPVSTFDSLAFEQGLMGNISAK